VIGRTRLYGFDLLRSYALILVVGYHLYPGALPGGFVAVDIFFLLSGFLVTRSILTNDSEGKGYSLSGFVSKRFFRLFPAMAVCVVICTGIAFFVSRDFNANIETQVFGSFAFFDNWAEIIAGASYENNLFPHLFTNMWSLGVEFEWYIVWGIVIFILAKVSNNRRLPLGMLYIFAGIFAIVSGVLMISGASHVELNRLYFGTDTHSASLFLGAALCCGLSISQRKKERKLRNFEQIETDTKPTNAGNIFVCRVLQIAVLVTVLYIALKVQWNSNFAFTVGIPLTAVLACILVYVMLNNQTVFKVDDNRFFVWLASRSYCIYLYHWPFSALLSNSKLPLKLQPILVIILAVAISELTYRFVEMPFSSHSQREKVYGKGRRLALTPLILVLLISGGYAAANIATAPHVTSIEMDFRDNTDIMNRDLMSALDTDLQSLIKKPMGGVYEIDSVADVIRLHKYMGDMIVAKKKQEAAEKKAQEVAAAIEANLLDKLQKPTEVGSDSANVPQLTDDDDINWRDYVY
jgi:peptidoglycan/LPS O-acetylase OafA/YrhL